MKWLLFLKSITKKWLRGWDIYKKDYLYGKGYIFWYDI